METPPLSTIQKITVVIAGLSLISLGIVAYRIWGYMPYQTSLGGGVIICGTLFESFIHRKIERIDVSKQEISEEFLAKLLKNKPHIEKLYLYYSSPCCRRINPPKVDSTVLNKFFNKDKSNTNLLYYSRKKDI